MRFKKMIVGDIIRIAANRLPTNIGVVHGEVRLTWRQINERVNAFANALIDAGLQKGERVAILANNCHQYLEVYLALAKAGLVATPLNTWLKHRELQQMLDLSQPAAIVTDRANVAKAGEFEQSRLRLRIGIGTGHGLKLDYEDMVASASRAEPKTAIAEDDPFSFAFRIIKNRTVNTIDLRINAIREADPVTGAPNPFADRRVRLAMQQAIDRDAIIKNLLKGMGEKVAVLFPEDIGRDPDLKPYPYDPKMAKQLLAEAGYPKGITANYYGLVGQRMPMSKEVGEAVAQYLTAAGIRTKVINEEYGMWLKRSNSRDSKADVSLQLYPFGYGMTWVGVRSIRRLV